MGFKVAGAQIFSDVLEVIAAEGCNFTCAHCDHLSPVADKAFPDIREVERGMERLAPLYKVDRIRVLGGEPLLRPDLLEFLQMLRSFGIHNDIRVVTNARLLPRWAPKIFDYLDSLEVSVYPGSNFPMGFLEDLSRDLEARGKRLYARKMDHFRRSYTENRFESKILVDRIYRTCRKVHVWGCQTLYGSRFYKCSSAYAIEKYVTSRLDSGIDLNGVDDVGPALRQYLDDTGPLGACNHCLGVVGVRDPHRFIPTTAWRSFSGGNPEHHVDMDYLAAVEKDPSIDWDCGDFVSDKLPRGVGVDQNVLRKVTK